MADIVALASATASFVDTHPEVPTGPDIAGKGADTAAETFDDTITGLEPDGATEAVGGPPAGEGRTDGTGTGTGEGHSSAPADRRGDAPAPEPDKNKTGTDTAANTSSRTAIEHNTADGPDPAARPAAAGRRLVPVSVRSLPEPSRMP
jgi:hypothetical protein